ncbi:PGF-pre-PGF domain-containing protein [Candidatus Woesearchaeota archaeon]|nr:PGF-pre-PGF domain-containing protein [Candidatus Woesearchaeota archaeon]
MKIRGVSFLLVLFIIVCLLSLLVFGLESVNIQTIEPNQSISNSIILNSTTDQEANNITYIWIDQNSGVIVDQVIVSNNTELDTEFNTTYDTSLLPDGIYNLVINATNSSGALVSNTTVTSIVIDNNPPSVNLETLNNTLITTNNPSFSFNYTDVVAQTSNCSLYVNEVIVATNTSAANNTGTFLSSNLASEGTFSWYVNCTDSVGNIGQSSIFSITYTNPPSDTFNSPSNSSNHNDNFVLNLSVNDNDGISLVQYRIDDSNGSNITDWLSISNFSDNIFNTTININNLVDGNYTIRINSTDNLGVSTTNNSILFYVDTTDPTISSFSLSANTVVVGNTLTASCSAIDNLDSSVITSVTGLSSSNLGTFTATCTAIDDAGNLITNTLIYTIVNSGSSGSSSGGSSSSNSITKSKIDNSISDGISSIDPRIDDSGYEPETLAPDIPIAPQPDSYSDTSAYSYFLRDYNYYTEPTESKQSSFFGFGVSQKPIEIDVKSQNIYMIKEGNTKRPLNLVSSNGESNTIKSIVLNLNREIQDTSVKVAVIKPKIDNFLLEEPIYGVEREVYDYVVIDGLENDTIKEIELTFEINKTWLEDEELCVDDVELGATYDEYWRKVDAQILQFKDDKIIYKAKINGTKNLAITAKSYKERKIVNDEYELPEVLILPDSPFYPIKKFGEKVEIFLTPQEELDELNLKLAEKRLSEAKFLALEVSKDYLQELDSDILINSNHDLNSIDLSNLQDLGDDILINDNDDLNSLNFDKTYNTSELDSYNYFKFYDINRDEFINQQDVNLFKTIVKYSTNRQGVYISPYHNQENVVAYNNSPNLDITSCSDSDGGKNYPQKGEVIGKTETGGSGRFEDFCRTDRTLLEFYCQADGLTRGFEEFSCDANQKCENGACVPNNNFTTIGSCTDSDGGRNLNAQGTTQGSNVLGQQSGTDHCIAFRSIMEYYCNSKGEFESELTSCPIGQQCKDGKCVFYSNTNITCLDRDNGKIYTTRAETEGYNENGIWIDEEDSCVYGQNSLTEWYCENGKIKSDVYNCGDSKQCIYGACVSANISCEDTDGGRNILQSGNVTIVTANGITESYQDLCDGSRFVNEYYCTLTEGIGSSRYYCGPTAVCVNGECRPESTVNHTNPTCSDNDKGIEPFLKGKTIGRSSTGYYSTWEDSCASNDSVFEYYCDDKDIVTSTLVNCQNGQCKDGRCENNISQINIIDKFAETQTNTSYINPIIEDITITYQDIVDYSNIIHADINKDDLIDESDVKIIESVTKELIDINRDGVMDISEIEIINNVMNDIENNFDYGLLIKGDTVTGLVDGYLVELTVDRFGDINVTNSDSILNDEDIKLLEETIEEYSKIISNEISLEGSDIKSLHSVADSSFQHIDDLQELSRITSLSNKIIFENIDKTNEIHLEALNKAINLSGRKGKDLSLGYLEARFDRFRERQGLNGLNGINGLNGLNGLNGINGLNGLNGTMG